MSTLRTPDVTAPLRRMAAKSTHLAFRVRQYLAGIIGIAIHEGLRMDGQLLSLDGALPPINKGNIPALSNPSDIAMLVTAIYVYASPLTRGALQLAMWTAMRPAVVAGAL